MEKDQQQSPYSVLTIDEVKDKMMKQIEEISNIFWISKSDATILLMNFRWSSLMVSERLSESKEKLLTESGLRSVLIDWNQDSSCGNCDEIDDDELISTPCCSHEFCITCWRHYLDKNFYSLEQQQNQTMIITCPKQDCPAAVGADTIEKLTVRDQEVYERFVLRSYLEGNKASMIKMCPASGCKYAIEFHLDENDEEFSLNVVCLCGHTFCWRCKLESHRPVTCNNAAIWLSSELKELQSLAEPSGQTRSTKSCPKCYQSVSLNGVKHRQFLTCDSGSKFHRYPLDSVTPEAEATVTSVRFCSKCSVEEKLHREKSSGLYGVCHVPERLIEAEKRMTCVKRWEAEEISVEEAKNDLIDFNECVIKNPNSILKERDIRIVREGYMLIAQCRQVLKWSCAYEHFHTQYEISKQDYLRFLQEIAKFTLKSYLKTLVEELEAVFSTNSYEKLCHFRYMVTTATSNIGNFFYHFIKALQGGLVDVKVKSYNNEAGLYWFCDRCTYGNSWLHKECQMCCDPTISPMEDKLSDLSLTQF